MKLAYWVVAALLGLLYLYAGGLKLVRTQEQLRPMMKWVDTVPMWSVRLLGLLEILGVLGLVLPPLTGTAPAVALAAAICFVVLQVLATRVHLAQGEGIKDIGINLVLIVLAAAEVWLATAWLG